MDGVLAALGVGGLASNIIGNSQQQSNFDEQMRFAKYQYEDSKRYNSAPEQVKRLRAAGINPAFAFGQNAGTATAVSQPAAPAYNPLDMNGLASIGTAVESTPVNVEKTKSEVQLNHLYSISQDFKNFLDKNFAVSERSEGLNKIRSEIKDLTADALLKAAQEDYTGALKQLARAEEFFNYAAGGHQHQLMENAAEDFKWIALRARAYIHSLESSAYRDIAEGNLAGLEYNIKNDPEVIQNIRETFGATLQSIKSSNKLTDKQVEYANKLIQKAQNENDAFWWKFALDYLIEIGATAAQIATLRAKVGALSDLSDAAQRNSRTRAERLDNEYNGYETTETYQYKNGKPHKTSTVQHSKRRRR